jgi:hypothetical protein
MITGISRPNPFKLILVEVGKHLVVVFSEVSVKAVGPRIAGRGFDQNLIRQLVWFYFQNGRHTRLNAITGRKIGLSKFLHPALDLPLFAAGCTDCAVCVSGDLILGVRPEEVVSDQATGDEIPDRHNSGPKPLWGPPKRTVFPAPSEFTPVQDQPHPVKRFGRIFGV